MSNTPAENRMTSPGDNDNKITNIVTRCIQHSILKLCNEQVSFCRTLHVLGVLSLTIDSQEQEVIIKINDTLKRTDSPASGNDTDTNNDQGGDGQVPPKITSAEPFGNEPSSEKWKNSSQPETHELSLEDQGSEFRQGIDEMTSPFCKMRGRKQRRPIKLNNGPKVGVIANKRTDENIEDSDVGANDHSDDVIVNKNSNNLVVSNSHADDDIVDNQPHDVTVDKPEQVKLPNSQKDIDHVKEETTLIALDLIKREHASPSLLIKEGKDTERQSNSAINCMKPAPWSPQVSRYSQGVCNRITVAQDALSLVVSDIRLNEQMHFEDPEAQQLSVRKLLTSNGHGTRLEHLEKIAALRRQNNFSTYEGERTSKQANLTVSQSRSIVSQINAQLAKPIVIEPIYQSPGKESYKQLQLEWGFNNVQETPLNFSIKALNAEVGHGQHDGLSPSHKKQQQQRGLECSPSNKYISQCMANPYLSNGSGTGQWSGKDRRVGLSVHDASLAQTNYIYGSYRLPSYDILGNRFQSFFKQPNLGVNVSGHMGMQDVHSQSTSNGTTVSSFSPIFSRNATAFPNSHRLHPRRILSGSLAWGPDKVHQKRLRKAIVQSSKIKKVSNEKSQNSDASGVSHRPPQSAAQVKSSKIEGQYLVDSMSPETTRKRRRRGLDEALTSDEIAEYMGSDFDGTTPSSFACKYCTEESPVE